MDIQRKVSVWDTAAKCTRIETMTFTLTEEEREEAYRIVSEESARDTLIEELEEAEESGDLEGCDLDALLDNETFMKALQARWDKYNGNDSSSGENFDEALSVTLHELKLGTL